MHKLKKSFCATCKKPIYRSTRRFNESVKFGWKTYCSKKCERQHKRIRQTLICENCGKSFERSPHAISPHNYCSQSCAAIVNNKKCLKGRARIKPKLKACAECGKLCRKSTNVKYCSLLCRRKAEWYTPEQLLGAIRNSAHKLKRVPTKRELKNINDSCRKTFGSWNKAVAAAGFQPNRSHNQRMYKCVNARANDGHICDSISELIVDNWLAKNRISHERNTPYPYTNHKADWSIPFGNKRVFIEYFGLAKDSPRYDRSVKEKLRLCKKQRIPLVAIYPRDLYPNNNLDNILKDKLRSYLST